MRVGMVTLGSRADLEPFLTLGRTLQKRGHEIELCAHDVYQETCEAQGFRFRSFGGDPNELVQKFYRQPTAVLPVRTLYRTAASWLEPLIEGALTAVSEMSPHVDALVLHHLFAIGGAAASSASQPLFEVVMAPTVSTRRYPHPSVLRLANLGPLNGLTYLVRDFYRRRAFVGVAAKAKRLLQARGAAGGAPMTVLLAYSEALTGKVGDGYHGQSTVSTGYWFDTRQAPLSPQVESFLAAGSKPICVTFGSWGSVSASDWRTLPLARVFERAVRAVEREKLRAILLTRWPLPSSADVLVVPEAPYDTLFPRVAAVVHHGSAGSAHPAARAGVPSVVLPIHVDQFLWARALRDAGVAPAPMLPASVNEAQLAGALRAACSPAMAERARELGRVIQAEPGVERAADAIEERLRGTAEPRR